MSIDQVQLEQWDLWEWMRIEFELTDKEREQFFRSCFKSYFDRYERAYYSSRAKEPAKEKFVEHYMNSGNNYRANYHRLVSQQYDRSREDELLKYNKKPEGDWYEF